MDMASLSDIGEWEDVLPLFKRTAFGNLSNNRALLAVPNLNLFELMNASEIMDSKMDQCYNLINHKTSTLSASMYDLSNDYEYTTHQDNTDVELLKTLSIIKILQWLLINEISVYDGHSSLETLYYCKYTWSKTSNLQSDCNSGNVLPSANVLLTGYCKSLMSCISDYCNMVTDADLFEGKHQYIL